MEQESNDLDLILPELLDELVAGKSLKSVCTTVYTKLRKIMPLQRLGIALLDDKDIFTSKVNISEGDVHLCEGYQASAKGSSLWEILENRQARVINNLPAYLEMHPSSASTRLVVNEGIRSNLSIPLVSQNRPLGILFFSSTKLRAYSERHLDMVRHIAGLLSVAVEKALLAEKMDNNRMKFLVASAEKDGLAQQLAQRSGKVEVPEETLPGKSWKEWEQFILNQTLRRTHGRIYGPRGAARLLDLPPTTLQGKLRKHGIKTGVKNGNY